MNDVATIGHNEPPEAPSVVARLREEYAAEEKRRDDLLAGVERFKGIENDTDAGTAADFAKQISAAIKKADSHRKAEKEPFLEGGRQVDGFFKRIVDPLNKAKAKITAELTTWERKLAEAERQRRLEEERRAREEAERKRQEAEAAAAAAETEDDLTAALFDEEVAEQASADAVDASRQAAAKASDLAAVRGDYGAHSSLRTFWDFEIVAENKIDLEALRSHIHREAIEKAVRSYVKAGGRKLDGVRIFENTKAVVR